MNGIISGRWLRRVAAGLGCLAGAVAGPGCYHYDQCVDRCYPERWNYIARQEVNRAFAPQIANGHVLDQTVWNWQFEPGSDQLTPGGMEHLAYLARRRPHADPCIYVQTAQVGYDVTYEASAPDKMIVARQELDNRRVMAVQNYLSAQTSGRGLAFQVAVHDPGDPSISSTPANLSVQSMYSGARGTLGAGGGSVTGGGGAVASGGSGGGYR